MNVDLDLERCRNCFSSDHYKSGNLVGYTDEDDNNVKKIGKATKEFYVRGCITSVDRFIRRTFRKPEIERIVYPPENDKCIRPSAFIPKDNNPLKA